MENLKALVYKGDLTPYQRALAQREFEGIVERLEIYEKAVKNNAVLPHVSGSLPSDTDINEKAWEHYDIKAPINEKGLKFKMYCEFINGAKWLRDLLSNDR